VLILALTLLLLPLLIGVYSYVVYPAILFVVTRSRPMWELPPEPTEWPMITITLPMYNEERVIRQRLGNLIALDYPADRRHILVLSDASTDKTDEIAREFEDQGVELFRLPVRAGKSAAENAALHRLRGDIVVNVDATTKIFPKSLKALVRAFGDPTVGVASGRDVSMSVSDTDANGGESGYVGYEMWVRQLETRWSSIVGASGCFYGIRRSVYDGNFPLALSRDFASALMAHEHGFRAVSVDAATCGVPRVPSLMVEYRRKIRTMHRGLETLGFKRHLLNPFRHGRFAFMLFSHKLCRWLVYPAFIPATVGMLLLPMVWPWAAMLIPIAGTVLFTGWRAMKDEPGVRRSKGVALLGFLVASNLAGLLAWVKTAQRTEDGTWEPTRRTA